MLLTKVSYLFWNEKLTINSQFVNFHTHKNPLSISILISMFLVLYKKNDYTLPYASGLL